MGKRRQVADCARTEIFFIPPAVGDPLRLIKHIKSNISSEQTTEYNFPCIFFFDSSTFFFLILQSHLLISYLTDKLITP